jgi:hypothetical protein
VAVVPSKPKKNIFGNDSSDDEESNVDWVKQSLKVVKKRELKKDFLIGFCC